MADVVMPRLSDSMEEGTVLQWLKAVGDEVAVGDELVEIETDKANMAYEADVAGTLTEILVPEGETVAIGTPIARVGDSAGGALQPGSTRSRGSCARTTRPSSTPQGSPTSPPGTMASTGRKLRRWRVGSQRNGELDLAQLHGSGPGGRIVKADVEGASAGAGRAGVRAEAPEPA